MGHPIRIPIRDCERALGFGMVLVVKHLKFVQFQANLFTKMGIRENQMPCAPPKNKSCLIHIIPQKVSHLLANQFSITC